MSIRGLGLEREILLLVFIPLLGGLLPGSLIVWRAQRDLVEMSKLQALSRLVWKIAVERPRSPTLNFPSDIRVLSRNSRAE